MAKITNHEVLPLTLPSKHVIAGRGGVLVTTNDVLRGDSAPMLTGLSLSGAITVEFDPEPTPEEAVIAQASIAAPEVDAAPVATTHVDVPVDPPAATKIDTAAKAKT